MSLLVNSKDQGGEVLSSPWDCGEGEQYPLEAWPLSAPSYLWAEVLLDTTGETSEIGWLTYPQGGVSVTLAFPTPGHLPDPAPGAWGVGRNP